MNAANKILLEIKHRLLIEFELRAFCDVATFLIIDLLISFLNSCSETNLRK